MKKKLYLDELEGFLSESAEDLRMDPSLRVWRNIDEKIHGEKKWPALTFSAIFIGAITLAGLIFMKPDKDLFQTKPMTIGLATAATHASTNTGETFVVTQNPFVAAAKSATTNNEKTVKHLVVTTHTSDVAANNSIAEKSTNEEGSMSSTIALQSNQNFQSSPVVSLENHDWTDLSLHASSATNFSVQNSYYKTDVSEQMQQGVTPETANKFIAAANFRMDESNAAAPTPKIALQSKKASRWSVQYYATPSLSYRMLSEEKQVDNFATSISAAPGNNFNSLETMVNHKPKVGIEAGVAVMYNVTENFRVKAGVQLNYRQYAIDAYSSSTSQPALIRIDQGNNIFDTIYASTSVSNVGLQQNAMQITNHFFQIGIPVGFELSMANFKTGQFVLAATFQPTYNVGQQAWLISTDYQSYVKQPDLMRKWNFNTGIEAFLRFSNKRGNLNYQVGPQIRYQLLPGAQNKYPVREHLIDYGIKFGVSKTLN